ncbi:hypothetical protein [Levilactobacillus cerevisiae]|uniref:hypothetical protein n=2 Tax=Levilactobacillus cerevisiae TaxID=1704076 RepID=UPI000F79EDF4
MMKRMTRKLLLTSLAVMAGFFLVVTTASASTHTYKDKTTRATVTVTKKKGKVTAIVYQLKTGKAFHKRYRTTTKFYTKLTPQGGTRAYLVRKNQHGKVTYKKTIPKILGHKYASVQTAPKIGEVGDVTEGIFMNVDYYGNLKGKRYHHALANFTWWWNTMNDNLTDIPSGNAVVLRSGKVSFSDKLNYKLPD